METNESTKKTGGSKNIIIGVLAAALLGSVGYTIYNFNKVSEQEKEITNLDIKADNMETAKAQLKIQFDSLNLQYDEMRSANDLLKGDLNSKEQDLATKNSAIAEKDRQIQEKRTEIQRLLANNNATVADLKKAQSLIASLQNDIISLKGEIARLTAENDTLKVRNTKLSQERDTYSQELVKEREVSKQKDEIIEAGSTLNASNFVLTGLKVRDNGKERESEKAKRINKMRVSFVIAENRITQSGSKEFYIAMYRPSGELASFSGGGSFQSKTDGTINYTDKINVDYTQGTQQTVSFDWTDENFEKGDYKMVVYQNGYEIGRATKTLK